MHLKSRMLVNFLFHCMLLICSMIETHNLCDKCGLYPHTIVNLDLTLFVMFG